ncbi:sigma-70 family RNA polymerase sigma factor [Mariniblastus fucicola]|uniref:ECF RNA polymerase sigma factor SigW n=1 Tax=Mariniblastus fucicola TaxID=980251 RepID=A0A5B9P838_9BACT|nr:sigma-70 family RNA polymerase sigma factor [Mariniblastus fucicola]QEG22458.1 ECF RNA polymerase sigma factor SigW [Mariniblastus fucicola]
MAPSEKSERFVSLLTEHQNRIYGYVYSLLGDHSRASDVVQEVNLTLWRKIDEFEDDRPFLPWAFGVARFQVLAHLRDRKRDRLLLDAELAESLSGQLEKSATQIDSVRVALRGCLQELSPSNRQLIEERYFKALPVEQVAQTSDRTVGAIKVALLRIRRQLAQCVQKRSAMEGLA